MSYKHLWEICRISKLGADGVGTEMSWLDFEVKRWKVKVTTRLNVGKYEDFND